MVEIGKVVDDFELPANGGKSIKLSELRGKNVVLYFYPRDNTPGCTKEGIAFGEAHEAFCKHNTVILGVSRESVASHEKFIAKFEFPFDLLSDKEETLCKQFDVIKEKNMYGKKVLGIERSTFLIDAEGTLVHQWRKVKVPGHVDAVLSRVEELSAQ